MASTKYYDDNNFNELSNESNPKDENYWTISFKDKRIRHIKTGDWSAPYRVDN